jgi:hypothetical protein
LDSSAAEKRGEEKKKSQTPEKGERTGKASGEG